MSESNIQLINDEVLAKEYDLSEYSKETKTKISRSLIITNKRVISRVNDGEMISQQEMLVFDVSTIQCAYDKPKRKRSSVPIVFFLIGLLLIAFGIIDREYMAPMLIVGGVLLLVGVILAFTLGGASKEMYMAIRILGRNASSSAIVLGNPLLLESQGIAALELHVSKVVAISLVKDLGSVIFALQKQIIESGNKG